MELKKDLIAQIQTIIANAQVKAIRSVDTERMLMYWQIGKKIFEEEQQGQDRAEYGKFLLKSISDVFQPQFGSGFSVRQLERNRQFYRAFPIWNALRTELSWTHYRLLCRLDTEEKKNYYLRESIENNWNSRTPQGQIEKKR